MKARIAILALVGLALLGAAASAASRQGPGDFDATFAGRGFVTRGFGTEPGRGGLEDAAPMPDGGFVALVDRGSIGRYRADGSLDTGFGEDGYLIHVAGMTRIGTAPDGRVYGLERVANGFALARWTGEGMPDSSFGSGGSVTVDARESKLDWMAVLADGSAILAGLDRGKEGSKEHTKVVVVKVRPDGSPDPGFGAGGTAVFDFGTDNEHFEFALDGERLLLAAYAGEAPALVRRFTPAGEIDPTFAGAEGFPTKSFSGGVNGMVVRSDGDVVIASGAQVVAMLPNGGPDPAFGEAGVAKVPELSKQVREPMLLAGPGGTVVFGGTTYPEGKAKLADLVLARVTAGGSLDLSFGAGGLLVTDAGAEEKAAALVELAGGDILLGGRTNGSSTQLAAARYSPGGTLVPAFGVGGILVARPLTHAEDLGNDVVAGMHGGVVVTGRAAGRALVASYLRNGRPDPAFAEGGLLTLSALDGDHDEEGLSIARYPGGRFLVGTGSYDGAALVMLDSHGELVRGFGDGGIAATDLGHITDLAVLRGGEILAAGSTARPCHAVVERFDGDGRQDRGFGEDGEARVGGGCRGLDLAVRTGGGFAALIPLSRTIAEFSADGTGGRRLVADYPAHRLLPHQPGAIAFDSRGGLLIGGTLHDRLGLVRLDRDGEIDPGFGRGGFVLREVGSESRVTGIRIDSRGRIVALARAETCDCGGPTPAVVRFLPGGGPDRSFGRQGVWTGLRGRADVEAMTLLRGRAPTLTGWAYNGGEDDLDLLIARLRG